MKTTSITKNGKTVYRVYLGQDSNGKKRYKQFKTEEDASTWVEDELNRQREHGKLTANLDGVLVAVWNRMDKELKALGSSLEQAGSETARRLKSVRKEGTAKACLNAFIASKIKQGRKPAYISDIKSRCLRFLEEHPSGLLARSISPELIRVHLDDLPGATLQRDNQYRNLGAWLRWAVHHGWIGLDPMPPKLRGMAAKAPRGEAVILAPSKAKSLLLATLTSNEKDVSPCGLDVMPFVALSLFAGIRPAEFRKNVYEKNGTKKVIDLNWSDITPEGIRISAELSKTGLARVIPLHETLKRWIEFHFLWRKTNTGPILPPRWRETWDGWRKNYWVDEQGKQIKWHADQLRHSFGTYQLAITKNAGQVALEMGNSQNIVLKHYWQSKTLQNEAEEFWGLHPVATLGPKLAKKMDNPATPGGFFDR
jgi:hypothetical protein